MAAVFSNSGRENAFFYLWTFFGKQNMWCGMNRKLI